MQKYNKKPASRKRLISLVIGAAVIVALLVFGIYKLTVHPKKPTTTNTVITATGSTVNLDPPTDAEKQQSDANKDAMNQPTTTPVTTADGKQKVTPVIVSAGSNGAKANVPGIFEEGGTCTATFTHGGDVITTTSTGLQNSNYTSCAPMNLNSPLNIQGSWSVVVSYLSATASGSSAPQSFTVN